MDDNQLIAIISIIVAIVFGIPAYIAILDRPRTKIFFFKKYHLNLYDNLVKNILGFDIKYQGKNIEHNLFVYKGIFICSGKDNIAATDDLRGLIVKIKSDKGKWHSGKIIKKTEELDVNTSVNGPRLTIDFPILRDKNFFVIEALGESENLEIGFFHRYKDVPDIDENTAGIEKVAIRKVIFSLISWFIMVSIAAFYFYALSDSRPVAKYYNKNKEELVTFYPEQGTREYKVEDSLRRVAEKDYSLLGLMLTDETILYKVNQDKYVGFRLAGGLDVRLILIFCILIPLAVAALNTLTIIRFGIKYNRYRKVASLASKLLDC